jgi:hypothetical protein
MNHMQSRVFLCRRGFAVGQGGARPASWPGSFLTADITHMGRIVAWTVEDRAAEHVAVVSEEVRAAIEGMDLSEFGDGAKYQEDLRKLFCWNTWTSFLPTTETVPGVEYVIQLKPDAYSSQLSRPSFRKSPKELATERQAMWDLLERGIVQPSSSCYGTNNVFVEKKRHPDGTPDMFHASILKPYHGDSNTERATLPPFPVIMQYVEE